MTLLPVESMVYSGPRWSFTNSRPVGSGVNKLSRGGCRELESGIVAKSSMRTETPPVGIGVGNRSCAAEMATRMLKYSQKIKNVARICLPPVTALNPCTATAEERVFSPRIERPTGATCLPGAAAPRLAAALPPCPRL